MTDKLWFRKSDGALVRPTMKPSNATFRAASWQNHIASLPALTDIVVDPEYAKTLKDGWVKVERVRYQTGEHSTWYNCHKAVYYNTYPKSRRRIVILAPVEKVKCHHEGLVDTGVGYYHCEACNKGWTYAEWESKSQPTQQTGTGEEAKSIIEKASAGMTTKEQFDYSEGQLQRLYEWLMDEQRKPAQTFFTSGWLRNVAREIESRLQAASGSEEKDKEIEKLEARIRELEEGLREIKEMVEGDILGDYQIIEKVDKLLSSSGDGWVSNGFKQNCPDSLCLLINKPHTKKDV
jgi:hypothetical protein